MPQARASQVAGTSSIEDAEGEKPAVQRCFGGFMGISSIKKPRQACKLRPETWTRLMVAVMQLSVGPDPGILPGSGP